MAIAVLSDDELSLGFPREARSPLRLVAGGESQWQLHETWVDDDVPESFPLTVDGATIRPRIAVRRRATQAVRRRRLAVAGVSALALVAALVPLGSVLGRAMPDRSAPSLSAGSLPISTRAGEGTFYVVQPGDTIRSIAARIRPDNPGAVVSQLAARLGSDQVVAGEHIPLS